MTEFVITAPSEGYNGKVGAVTFVNGTATADSDAHPGELSYFRNTDGYTVTSAAETEPVPAASDGAGDGSEGDGEGKDTPAEPPEVPEEPEPKKTRSRAKKA